MDLIVEGGNPNAMVEGLIIQELDSDHNLIFEWSSWDHFDVLENPYFEPWTQEDCSFTQIPLMVISMTLSFGSRNMDEITKIHRTSGEIIWRWGGAMNEFDFVNDYPFTHQHTLE